jgi:integrase
MKRGQHIQESLETRSFDTAKRVVENMERDILLGLNWKKEREIFEDAWLDFLEDKAKGIKTTQARAKTLKEYAAFGVRFYLPFYKDMRLSEIESEWPDFVEQLRAKKPEMQFDNVRKYLMGFLSWAYRKGKIRVKPELFDPDLARRESRDHDGPGFAYTPEQLAEMRLASDTRTPEFRLFMYMAQFMGMRPGEITQLQKDRIDFGHHVLRLRRSDTKTKQGRIVPIHSEVYAQLFEQYERSEGSPYLFPNAWDKTRPMDPTGFKKHWAAVGGHLGGRMYDLRHSFITIAIKSGLNPAAVAVMTGTSLSMIEKRYLHFTAKDLTKEVGRLSL